MCTIPNIGIRISKRSRGRPGRYRDCRWCESGSTRFICCRKRKYCIGRDIRQVAVGIFHPKGNVSTGATGLHSRRAGNHWQRVIHIRYRYRYCLFTVIRLIDCKGKGKSLETSTWITTDSRHRVGTQRICERHYSIGK